MASDMVVALARSTVDGRTYFGHNDNRNLDRGSTLFRTPARPYAPGEHVILGRACIPQVRHTWSVLGGRAAGEWGYRHGVNEKGVFAGCTPIRTRFESMPAGLTGPDLVRLTLERAVSAAHAVEVLIDLIGRHGLGAGDGDTALLVGDAREAFLLEATGRHWVMAEVGAVRAVTGICTLRQDWDRISRGLSDLCIQHGWWPEDGCKLDFGGTLGVFGPTHARDIHRWGQAILRLEHHSGQIDTVFLRELLRDLADLLAPEAVQSEILRTQISFLTRLGPNIDDLPLAWVAFGTPIDSVYFPLFVAAELPAMFTEAEGECRLFRIIADWQAEARRDRSFQTTFRSGLLALQQHLDEHLQEFLPEACELHRLGRFEELRRAATAFQQHCIERFDELAAQLSVCQVEPSPSEQLIGVGF